MQSKAMAWRCVLRSPQGAPGKPVGWQGRHSFSKLAYLASKVNTNLRPLSREGAVQ